MLTDKELAELDLAVALADGKSVPEIRLVFDSDSDWECVIKLGGKPRVYRPTRDRAEAMRLLVKHKLRVGHGGNWWICDGPVGSTWAVLGETPAIAICRAVVALSGTPLSDDTKSEREKV